jgi:hypothetical protein
MSNFCRVVTHRLDHSFCQKCFIFLRFRDFFAKAGNQLVLFGAIGLIVFGKLRTVMGTFITQGIDRMSTSLSGAFLQFNKNSAKAIEIANMGN